MASMPSRVIVGPPSSLRLILKCVVLVALSFQVSRICPLPAGVATKSDGSGRGGGRAHLGRKSATGKAGDEHNRDDNQRDQQDQNEPFQNHRISCLPEHSVVKRFHEANEPRSPCRRVTLRGGLEIVILPPGRFRDFLAG